MVRKSPNVKILQIDMRELGLPRFKSELRRYLRSAQVTYIVHRVANGAWFVTECGMCATPCVTLCTADVLPGIATVSVDG